MGALEWEVSLFVMERLLRDRCDVLRSAFVICVAILAFTLFLESSVRSQLLLNVRANVFVTILAETIHCCLVEPFVALGTVFFPFGMPLDYLPWHQGGLDIVCPGRCSYEHQHAEESNEQVAG